MEPQARFDLGRVFNRTTGAIGRNPGLFLGLAVLLQGLPIVLQKLLVTPAQSAAGSGLPDFTPTWFIATLFGFVCTLLLQVTVTRAAVIDLRGNQPTIAESFSGSLNLILPLLGLILAMILGITLGMVLLIVPGIILALMWSVAIPALVTERKGVFASLSRSRELTNGSKWKIFALAVLAWLILIVPTMVAMILADAFSPGGMEAYQQSTASFFVLFINAVMTVVFAVVLAAIYIELRSIKEGATAEDLATIFA